MKNYIHLSRICVMLCLLSCAEEQKSETIETYPIVHPIVQDTLVNLEYVADIQATQYIDIRARVEGYMEKIYVEEGSFVKKGQLLFSISSQGFRQEVLSAKAALKIIETDLKIANQELKNIRLLFEKNIISKAELEKAELNVESLEAQVEQAKSEVTQAEIELSYSEIHAPFDGFINRIPLKTGSLVSEGDLLTSLSDNREIFAYFNVSERDYFNFIQSDTSRQLRTVNLLLADNSIHATEGNIETIDGVIDQNTGSIGFRARFSNPDYKIKHGASAKIRVYQHHKNALLIPQKSTFEIQDKLYVYVIDEQNKVQLRNVQIAYRMPQFFIVETGLSESDKILYEGIQLVREGEIIHTELLNGSDVMKQYAQVLN